MQMCCFLYKKLESIKKIIHRGKILQRVVKETGINVAVIARKAGYKRVTYYLHLNNRIYPFLYLVNMRKLLTTISQAKYQARNRRLLMILHLNTAAIQQH